MRRALGQGPLRWRVDYIQRVALSTSPVQGPNARRHGLAHPVGDSSPRLWAMAAYWGLFVTIAAIVFLPSILHGGFDNWGNLDLYQVSPPPRFANAVAVIHSYDPRPLLAYLKIGEAALFGSHAVLYRVTAVGLGVLVALLVALVMLRLRLGTRLALISGLLTLVFPWADSTRLWSVASLNQVALILYLAALLAALEGLRWERIRAIGWHGLAWLLFAGSMLTYEAAAALIPFTGVLYVLVSRSRQARRLAVLDFAFGMALAGLTYALHSHGRSRATLHSALADLGHVLHDLAVLAPRSIDPFTSDAGVIIVALAVLTLFRLGWEHRDRGATPAIRQAMVAIVVGLLFSLLAALPLAGSGLSPLKPGILNRGNLDVAIPIAIVVGASVELAMRSWIRGPGAQAVGIGAILLAIAICYSVRVRDDISSWNHAAAIQEKVLRTAEHLASRLNGRMVFFVFGYPAMTAPGVETFAESWNLAPALSLTYSRRVGGIPLFGDAQLRCMAHGVYPLSPPGPDDAVQGGEGPQQLVPYGHALLLDIARRRVAKVTSRHQCVRLADSVHPGPWIAA